MDNNFNQGQQMQQAPVDPFAQNQMYAQQAPNQMYAQAAPKQPSNFNMFEMVSLILAGVGMLMVFLGTIFTCSCSASKTMEEGEFALSAIWILTLFGIFFAIGAVVLAILAMKDTKSAVKAGKLAKISAIVGVFAVIWGILPTMFICSYNCSLESAQEDMVEDLYDNLGDLGDMFK